MQGLIEPFPVGRCLKFMLLEVSNIHAQQEVAAEARVSNEKIKNKMAGNQSEGEEGSQEIRGRPHSSAQTENCSRVIALRIARARPAEKFHSREAISEKIPKRLDILQERQKELVEIV
jgi:hypothetical protein